MGLLEIENRLKFLLGFAELLLFQMEVTETEASGILPYADGLVEYFRPTCCLFAV
jgi:hypothetical protein